MWVWEGIGKVTSLYSEHCWLGQRFQRIPVFPCFCPLHNHLSFVEFQPCLSTVTSGPHHTLNWKLKCSNYVELDACHQPILMPSTYLHGSTLSNKCADSPKFSYWPVPELVSDFFLILQQFFHGFISLVPPIIVCLLISMMNSLFHTHSSTDWILIHGENKQTWSPDSVEMKIKNTKKEYWTVLHK